MSRGTLDTAMPLPLSLTGLSPSLAGLSRTVLLTFGGQLCSPNPAMHARRFGLCPFRSPLLWTSNFPYGKFIFFLFLRLLRCFSSPGSPRIPIKGFNPLFSMRYMRSAHVGFPIQKSAGHRIFAPCRSLSQLITSFIGSQCQGIHPALLFA